MNDHLLIEAVRKMPARYVKPGINVTRFGESGIVAAHPELPAMLYKNGKWQTLGRLDVTTRRRNK